MICIYLNFCGLASTSVILLGDCTWELIKRSSAWGDHQGKAQTWLHMVICMPYLIIRTTLKRRATVNAQLPEVEAASQLLMGLCSGTHIYGTRCVGEARVGINHFPGLVSNSGPSKWLSTWRFDWTRHPWPLRLLPVARKTPSAPRPTLAACHEDPRDTRHVLGRCLRICSREGGGASGGFGVFRM